MGRKAVVAARGSTSATLGGYTEVGQQRADAARQQVLPASTVPRVIRVPAAPRSPAPAAGGPPQRDSYAGAQSSQAHILKSQCTVTL